MLNQIQSFLTVIEAGNFTKAGEKLNISTAAISKQMALLEKELGVTLLNRSFRQLALTEDGQQFYQKFKEIIEKVDEVNQLAQSKQIKLTGHLKIYGCAGLINYFIVPHLAEFTALHPALSIEIHNIDYVPDFYKQDPDIFVGIDKTSDALQKGEIIGAFLTDYRYIYCASPQYLAKHKKLEIELLNNHCYIAPPTQVSNMFEQKQEHLYKTKHFIQVNSSYSSLHAALNGMGMARLPDFMANQYLKSGELLHLFPDQDSQLIKAQLFYKKQRYVELKVITFKKFIQKKLSRNTAINYIPCKP